MPIHLFFVCLKRLMQPDYLMLGHFTRDLLPDGSKTPGGTSLYASLTAYRLGRSVGVVSAPADLPETWPDSIRVHHIPGLNPPTFENRYTSQGRQQILHGAARPISLSDIPLEWRSAGIVHLGPILAETPEDLVEAFPGALLGVTPQGFMREWGAELPGPINYRPWRPAPVVLRRINALVLSIEDVRGEEALVVEYAQACRLVALTRGVLGATLFVDGQPHTIPAFPAVERDPTGAGDVFASALLVRLHETGNPLEAARFAACVAARSVEGSGVSAIPMRAEVDARLCE